MVNKKEVREYQRSHESLDSTIARLMRKFGTEQIVVAVDRVAKKVAIEQGVVTPENYLSPAPPNSVTLRGAEREYGVTVAFLYHLAKDELIPVLQKGPGPGFPTYFDRVVVESVAAIYLIAKDRYIQPKTFFRLLLKGEDV